VIGLALAGLIAWMWLVVFKPSPAKAGDSNLRAEAAPPMRFLSWAVFVVGALVAWLVIAIAAHMQLSNGEPFVWMEGISIWPTETLRLLVAIMAVWFFIKTNASLRENEGTISKTFGLRFFTPPWWRFAPFFSKRRRKRAIASLSFRDWCLESEGRIVAKDLWKRYICAGEVGVHLIRVVPLTLFYIVGGICLILLLLLGFPPVPGRGGASFVLDKLFLFLAIISSVGLTFYIADVTMLNRRLIDYLVLSETKWPLKAYRNLRQRWKVSAIGEKSTSLPPGSSPSETPPEISSPGENNASVTPRNSTPDLPPERLLDEYLDIDLIATRTAVVGSLIYYPFILITLMIVSRISLFDNWTWPAGLFIVIAATGGYAAWSAWMLRRTAENARQTALKNLNDILIARTAEGLAGEAEAQTARETISIITAENRGAFAAISRHPLIRALLLPSGGAGIWALTQYLPGWF
jgi:hypothetical protein